MSEYAIALIRDDQIAETQALMNRCFDAKLASIFYLHPESTLVVTYQNQVVAGINLDVYQVNKCVKMGYIGWLYTDKDHRGNALAGKLLDEAISFLKEEGCTSLSACVEGDNPASFKQLANRGFTILALKDQIQLFKLGTAKVYHYASRFFDMGYFLWHKSLTGQSIKKASVGLKALLFTLLGNTLLFFSCMMGWNLLNLAGFHPFESSFFISFSSLSLPQKTFSLAIPSLFLLARTGAMFVLTMREQGKEAHREQPLQEMPERDLKNEILKKELAREETRKQEKPIQEKGKKVLYRGWDTAWILAILLTFTMGFPFPVPGNLYIKGLDWKLGKEQLLLARMGIAGQVAVALICLFAPKGIPLLFGLELLALDGFFFFYPFCGFNASRIKRMGAKTYGLSLAITLVLLLMIFL